MMGTTVTLRHFAAAKELAGADTEELVWKDGATVAQLRKILTKRGGRWTFLAKHARFARDDEFLFEAEEIYCGEEILVLPPAAGGAGVAAAQAAAPVRATLCHATIEPGDAERLVELDGTGAIATFVGTVRKESRGQRVQTLEYSAHEPLALKELERICQEAMERFGLIDVRVLHRLGLLQVGDIAVSLACAAGHRGPAMDACRFVIEELKARVPIWKKETTQDGHSWVGSTP